VRGVDVLVVGGGPAGSSCARELTRAGARVCVLDRARFPRDKVCAGWVTPPVFAELEIDPDEYARGHTLQRFFGFRVGVFPNPGTTVDCGAAISFGVRRCEFDQFLLQRCGAELSLGEALRSLERVDGRWIANQAIEARIVVGAGGNFCPIAKRVLGAQLDDAVLVRAQEAELRLEAEVLAACAVDPELPELSFCSDLQGYGWAVRKGEYLNIGIGRTGCDPLPAQVESFVRHLERAHALPSCARLHLRGHAYRLYPPPQLRVADEGVLLVGDAAGLAAPISGEGIRPAVESGHLAARAIAGARSADAAAPAERYADELVRRFGPIAAAKRPSWMPPRLRAALARQLVRSPRLARSLVIDRWFLHRDLPPLAAA
jgi:menaquinone-9 beta-reductase